MLPSLSIPPSYRNAAFGVAIANGRTGVELVRAHRALGAPQIFEVHDDKVLRWKVSGKDEPSLLDAVDTDQLSQVFAQHKAEWAPQRILTAKSNVSQAHQLDFFDVGLLPFLDHEARTKLDHRLRSAVALAIETFAHGSKFTDDLYPLLFRLIFRLIAAKMLADRGHAGNWNSDSADLALQSVEDFYFNDSRAEPALEDRDTKQATWEWIKSTCHFQNLSVDSLAYVYENTLVTQETRQAFGTHSTPYAIAEYVVRNLPFERLEQNERKVFEPFSGHSIFLVAAMQRMRELLPPQMASEDRHEYFVKMLSGIENDEFALEVGRLSLMLADYPNPDGWRLYKADAFDSPAFAQELRVANVVLCNPPFGRFTKSEISRYGDGLAVTKAREALQRVLKSPPQLLGFVLPKVFLEGAEYRQLRTMMGEIYSTFELLALPDRVFEHSDAETVVLLSAKSERGPKSLAVGQVLNSDLQNFYANRHVAYRAEKLVENSAEEFTQRMWLTQLAEVWETTSEFQTLGALAEIHRGIEYNQSLSDDIDRFISETPRDDFVAGLHSINDNIEPFIITGNEYLNVASRYMRGSAHTYQWSAPKLVVNARRRSRGNWKITASIDQSRLVCSQYFHAIWPKTGLSFEVLAAVLNGPVANAFVSTRDSGRDILIRTLRGIPIPEFSQAQEEGLSSLVRQYVNVRRLWISRQLNKYEAEAECRRLMSAIDAEVVKAYDLPPEQERKLLDWFTGSRRLGPVEFTEYFPRSFTPRIPLHLYISNEFAQASAAETIGRLPNIPPSAQVQEVLAYLDDGEDG